MMTFVGVLKNVGVGAVAKLEKLNRNCQPASVGAGLVAPARSS